MSAIPIPDPVLRRKRIILHGDVPSPVNPPSGCNFHPRCWLRSRLDDPAICADENPPLLDYRPDHRVACHFADRSRAELDKDLPVSSPTDAEQPATILAGDAIGRMDERPTITGSPQAPFEPPVGP